MLTTALAILADRYVSTKLCIAVVIIGALSLAWMEKEQLRRFRNWISDIGKRRPVTSWVIAIAIVVCVAAALFGMVRHQLVAAKPHDSLAERYDPLRLSISLSADHKKGELVEGLTWPDDSIKDFNLRVNNGASYPLDDFNATISPVKPEAGVFFGFSEIGSPKHCSFEPIFADLPATFKGTDGNEVTIHSDDIFRTGKSNIPTWSTKYTMLCTIPSGLTISAVIAFGSQQSPPVEMRVVGSYKAEFGPVHFDKIVPVEGFYSDSHKPKAAPKISKEPKTSITSGHPTAAPSTVISAPNGIAIGGGTVTNPTVNNYAPAERTISKEQRDKFIASLKPYCLKPFEVVVRPTPGNRESMEYAEKLAALITDSGCTRARTPFLIDQRPMYGVVVGIRDVNDIPVGANALVQAFKDATIPVSPMPIDIIPKGEIWVAVGLNEEPRPQ